MIQCWSQKRSEFFCRRRSRSNNKRIQKVLRIKQYLYIITRFTISVLQITKKDFISIDPKTGIQALVIEDSDPCLTAIEWTKNKDYRWLSLSDAYQRVGLEGIAAIGNDQREWLKEADHERRYGLKAPLRVEGYILFNSFLLSQRAVKDIDKLSDAEFDKYEWLNVYVAHNPQIDSVTKDDDENSLLVSGDLISKFNLKDISGMFRLSGSGRHEIGWLEADLTKSRTYDKQFFGKAIENYREKLLEMEYNKSTIISSPLPSMKLRAQPIEFENDRGYSFSSFPFWYKAGGEKVNNRVDRLHIFPVIDNASFEK